MGIKIQVQNQESYLLSLLLESDVYTLGIEYAGLAREIARFARNVPCFYGNGAATFKATLRCTDSVCYDTGSPQLTSRVSLGLILDANR